MRGASLPSSADPPFRSAGPLRAGFAPPGPQPVGSVQSGPCKLRARPLEGVLSEGSDPVQAGSWTPRDPIQTEPFAPPWQSQPVTCSTTRSGPARIAHCGSAGDGPFRLTCSIPDFCKTFGGGDKPSPSLLLRLSNPLQPLLRAGQLPPVATLIANARAERLA